MGYAAYFLAKSLSVDNIFVFVIIFSELHIPGTYQRRVLQFGIAGALVRRFLASGRIEISPESKAQTVLFSFVSERCFEDLSVTE
ncbi:MAG TPA: hypothetical protein VEL51_07400 [Vicinamibacterales bacterium]|nr:hypothetical protein [Vicinamibacterales bacterium]